MIEAIKKQCKTDQVDQASTLNKEFKKRMATEKAKCRDDMMDLERRLKDKCNQAPPAAEALSTQTNGNQCADDCEVQIVAIGVYKCVHGNSTDLTTGLKKQHVSETKE